MRFLAVESGPTSHPRSIRATPRIGQIGRVRPRRAPHVPSGRSAAVRFHVAPVLKPRPTLLAALVVAVQLAGSSMLQAQELQTDSTTAPVTGKSRSVAPFTLQDRVRFYQQTTFSPWALVGPLAGAALTQWITGNPAEWGQGFPGYGRRVLSGYSRQVIANSVGFGVALAAHEDPRHYLTGERSLWKRSLYAAREAVLSHNTSGGLMPAYSRIAGVYTAGFISNTWYPRRYSNIHSALYRGSTALASDIVWQEFKEFWPDVRRRLPWQK